MSDDKERRRPDEASEFSPFEDETEVRPNDGPPNGDPAADSTEPLPRTPADADRTQTFPAADDDATVVAPRALSDSTSVLPPVDARTQSYDRNTDNWADDGDAVWSGRAGVRAPRPGSGDDFTRTDWAAVPADEPRGKWWMPIVVGIVALTLLGLLAWGIFLIAESTGTAEDPPAVTPPAVAPVTTTPATAPPSTGPPSTQPPSTVATTTEPPSSPPAAPADITIPALKGLSSDEARAALDRKGMSYRLRFVTSDSPAGTVIDSDPTEGQQVPADTIITLIIAAPPNTPTAPTTTAVTPTGQPGGD
jgi:hypothetical protein